VKKRVIGVICGLRAQISVVRALVSASSDAVRGDVLCSRASSAGCGRRAHCASSRSALVSAGMSTLTSDGDPRKVVESRVVSGHDRPTRHPCCRGDDEVVRSLRAPLTPHCDEKLCMGFCDMEVVIDNGDRRDHVVDEALPLHSRRTPRQLNADSQLSNCDRCDRGVVIILDRVASPDLGAFRVDEVGGIEQKSRQSRSSTFTSYRTASSSP